MIEILEAINVISIIKTLFTVWIFLKVMELIIVDLFECTTSEKSNLMSEEIATG
jgi:hypothetical protein